MARLTDVMVCPMISKVVKFQQLRRGGGGGRTAGRFGSTLAPYEDQVESPSQYQVYAGCLVSKTGILGAGTGVCNFKSDEGDHA